DYAPCQEPIRSVKRQVATLVRLEYRLRIVSEKLIEVVQITKSLRTYIGGIQCAATDLIPGCHLEFAIELPALTCQRDKAGFTGGDRRERKFVNCIALLVRGAEQQAFEDLAVEFDIPDFTARGLQPTGDLVDVCR